MTPRPRLRSFQDLLALLGGPLEVFAPVARDLARRYAEYGLEAVAVLNLLARFAERQGQSLAQALADYRAQVESLAEERRRFGATGSYRPASTDELAVLRADAEFGRSYLYALTASSVLNRSRYEVRRHYRQHLDRALPQGGRLLEIGGGNCIDACYAAERAAVEVFELNPLARDWVKLIAAAQPPNLTVAEYGFEDRQRFDFVTMIELLEHLERPQETLLGARCVLKPDGRMYLTFAIRMPQLDHLTLFESVEACRTLLADCGLRALDELAAIDTLMPYEDEERWQLAERPGQALIYACLVAKAEPTARARALASFNDDLDLSLERRWS